MKTLFVLTILMGLKTYAAIPSEESKAKACLNAASVLQKVFHDNHGYYTNDVNRLDWGTDECIANFDFNMKSEKAAFTIEVKNHQKAAWKIDQKNQITKL